jgi:hypothetical protein
MIYPLLLALQSEKIPRYLMRDSMLVCMLKLSQVTTLFDKYS